MRTVSNVGLGSESVIVLGQTNFLPQNSFPNFLATNISDVRCYQTCKIPVKNKCNCFRKDAFTPKQKSPCKKLTRPLCASLAFLAGRAITTVETSDTFHESQNTCKIFVKTGPDAPAAKVSLIRSKCSVGRSCSGEGWLQAVDPVLQARDGSQAEKSSAERAL